MKFGLSNSTIDNIYKVFRRYVNLDKAVIYGSRAKGNSTNGSDIDLVLYGAKLTASIVYSIETDIDDLLLPYKFDICSIDEIDNNELLKHIKRVGQEFYSAKKT